jgi:hypothetical protein
VVDGCTVVLVIVVLSSPSSAPSHERQVTRHQDDLLTHPLGKDPGTKPKIETAKQPPPRLNPVIFSPSQSKYHLLHQRASTLVAPLACNIRADLLTRGDDTQKNQGLFNIHYRHSLRSLSPTVPPTPVVVETAVLSFAL